MKTLSEIDIKLHTIRHLQSLELVKRGDVIASEVSLFGLSRRIDLAALSNKLIGVEIKSELDNLKRLPEQLAAYGHVFEHLIVVVSEAHLAKTLILAPNFVDVWSISRFGKIEIIRPHSAESDYCAMHILKVLTLTELRALAQVPRRDSLSRAELTRALSSVNEETMRPLMRKLFARRFAQTSSDFWKSLGNADELTTNQIKELSRFKSRRDQQKQARSSESQFWVDWSVRASLSFNNSQSLQSSSVSCRSSGGEPYSNC